MRSVSRNSNTRSYCCLWTSASERSLGGESISEGNLMEWKKNIGDAVKKDEVIAMIETDKVSSLMF